MKKPDMIHNIHWTLRRFLEVANLDGMDLADALAAVCRSARKADIDRLGKALDSLRDGPRFMARRLVRRCEAVASLDGGTVAFVGEPTQHNFDTSWKGGFRTWDGGHGWSAGTLRNRVKALRLVRRENAVGGAA